ncbi:MAG: TlpA family protein disulfide reductase, partial [Vulcanimicrobiaceae bacterium]
NRLILYITLGLVVAIVVAVVAFYSRVPKSASTAPTQSNIKVGDVAPEFNVATTAGPFDLKNALAAGKPVFLEVFATWCPHCQHEVTVLNQLYQKYGGRVEFVAVSGNPYGMDGSTAESQADVIHFQQEFGAKYQIAFDPTMDVAGKYLSSGYPTLIVIDKAGKVSYLTSGETPQNNIATAINKALQ